MIWARAVVQSAIQRFSVQTISALSQATLTLVQSVDAAAVSKAQAQVAAALTALDQLFAAEREAEGDGEWRGVYWADRHRFTNFQARRREVLALNASLAKLSVRLPPSSNVDYA